MLDGLKTNKFAVVEEVGGYEVIALMGLDMVDGVAAVVVTGLLVSKPPVLWIVQGVFLLTSPCIVFYLPGDSCFFFFLLFCHSIPGGLHILV